MRKNRFLVDRKRVTEQAQRRAEWRARRAEKWQRVHAPRLPPKPPPTYKGTAALLEQVFGWLRPEPADPLPSNINNALARWADGDAVPTPIEEAMSDNELFAQHNEQVAVVIGTQPPALLVHHRAGSDRRDSGYSIVLSDALANPRDIEQDDMSVECLHCVTKEYGVIRGLDLALVYGSAYYDPDSEEWMPRSY